MVQESGILAVIHAPDLGRYSWQVLIEGERCVLLSGDFRNRSVISSRYYPNDNRPRIVPIQDAPRELIAAVQSVLEGPDP